MQIVVPVTDYIPRSILTADGDVVRRAAGIPARVQQRTLLKAWLTFAQTFAGMGQAILQLASVAYDVNSEWNTGTYTFTADRAMVVFVSAVLNLNQIPLNDPTMWYVRKNTAAVLRGDDGCSRLNYHNRTVSGIIELAVNDTIDFWYSNSTVNTHRVSGGSEATTSLTIVEMV